MTARAGVPIAEGRAFPGGLVRGAAEVEVTARGLRPHRLPGRVRVRFPDGQLLAMEAQPAGVRVVFTTDATTFTLVTHPTRLAYRGFARPRGRIDVYVDGERALSDELGGGDRVEVDLATGETSFAAGEPHGTTVAGLAAGRHRVEIWLPHNEAVDLVELRADAPVDPVPAAGPLWVHHGSSISQGSNALAPSETWPAVAARRAGVELRNLGLGGSALVDPFLARVIRDAPADLISVKLGINVVNLDVMRPRAFVPAVHGFLDTIRDGHPDTPLLLVSPLFCAVHEDAPGPGAVDPASFGTGRVRFVAAGGPADGRLTLRTVRDLLRSVVEDRADPDLHHLDGTGLYGPDDPPPPDGLHPDAAAHRLIGARFAEQAFAGGPFGRRPSPS